MSTPDPSASPPVASTTSPVVSSETPSSPLPASTTSTSPTLVPTTSSTPTSSNTTSSPTLSSSTSSLPPSTTSTSTSSTISSTTPTTATSTSQTSSSTTSNSVVTSNNVVTSNGQLITRTSIVTVSSAPTPSSTNQSSSTGFFHNKGAMAGVFSVVGVVAIVLLFFLLTSYLRRRRAREFDREIDEAAAAAAAAQPPDFDDYDYNSAAGGYGHYSETSHGTFSQPPLSHDQSANVHGSYDAYTGAAGAGAGAAGIGARGRSLRNGGQQDPYGALANPPEQYEMHETGRTWQQGIPRGGAGVPNYDILQAAGLASSDPYAVTRGPSTRSGLSQGHSQSGASGLTRSQSQGTSTLPTTVEGYPVPVPMPTPTPGYQGGQDAAYVPDEKTRYSALYTPGGGISTLPPDEDEDAYDGYQERPSGTLDNPHSPGFSGPHAGDDVDGEQNVRAPYALGHQEAARASFTDDDDYYNSGQRVLRVANE